MKSFLFFSLLVFFTFSTPGQKYREVDLRVNGIGSGSSYAAVIERFGKPSRNEREKYAADSACSSVAETHLTLFYPGLKIMLLGDGKGRDLKVYAIEVKSRRWSASGISIGDDAKTIAAKFGDPNSKEKNSDEMVYDYVTKSNAGGISFRFRNNKLIKIEMM